MLQDEYRREGAEEQRLAVERDGLPLGDSNKQKLENERKLEYNEYLAKVRKRVGRIASVKIFVSFEYFCMHELWCILF